MNLCLRDKETEEKGKRSDDCANMKCERVTVSRLENAKAKACFFITEAGVK